MKLEISPEPSEPERAAIEEALRRLAEEQEATASPGPWWREGLEENLESGAGPL